MFVEEFWLAVYKIRRLSKFYKTDSAIVNILTTWTWLKEVTNHARIPRKRKLLNRGRHAKICLWERSPTCLHHYQFHSHARSYWILNSIALILKKVKVRNCCQSTVWRLVPTRNVAVVASGEINICKLTLSVWVPDLVGSTDCLFETKYPWYLTSNIINKNVISSII